MKSSIRCCRVTGPSSFTSTGSPNSSGRSHWTSTVPRMRHAHDSAAAVEAEGTGEGVANGSIRRIRLLAVLGGGATGASSGRALALIDPLGGVRGTLAPLEACGGVRGAPGVRLEPPLTLAG